MAAELLKFQWVQWIDMTKVAISNQIWQQGVIKYTTRVKFGPHINRSSLYCLVEMSRWRWNWWVCCGWSVQYSNVRLSSVQTFYRDFIIIMGISVKLQESTKNVCLWKWHPLLLYLRMQNALTWLFTVIKLILVFMIGIQRSMLFLISEK